ncbi:MAG: hypothetical protein SVK08_00900 [Halobacteriota archaeon]|nr:hypothetical protein [Halobacteriota archaeon]
MADYWERTSQAWSEWGKSVGGVLRDRWESKQAEEFQQNEVQSFLDATTQFQNSLAEIEDGDMMAQAFTSWKNNTFMPFVTAATAKYGNNERIMTMVKQVVDANNQGLDEFMATEERMEEREQRPVQREREAEVHAAKIGQAEAETERARAGAMESRARAGAIARREEMEPLQKAVIPPEQLHTIDFASARRLINDPRFTDWKSQVDQRTDEAAVSRIITENLGQIKEDGTKWGQDRQADVVDANRMWQGSAMRRKTLERQRLVEAGFPMERSGDYYDDVVRYSAQGGSGLLPEERVPPLKPIASIDAAMGRIFASNTESMRAQGWVFNNVEGFIKNTLPEIKDYRELGPHVTSILEQSVQRDADGTAISPLLEGQEIKDYGEMIRVLQAVWSVRVGQLFAENATAHRARADKIGKAVIRKFGPQLASRYGIVPPQAAVKEAERMGEPAILGLLRRGAEAVGGLRLLEREL